MKAGRLLIVPLLTPLLAVLVVAALNPSPRVSFRVLTWVTPRAPLGIWLASAALGGAALSGVGVGLALRQEAGLKARQRISRAVSEPWNERASRTETWPSVGIGRSTGRQADLPLEPPEAPWQERPTGSRGQARMSVAPERAPGDPAPTVVVPFRVLRRPTSHGGEDVAEAPVSWSAATTATKRESVAVTAADDWEDEAAQEW